MRLYKTQVGAFLIFTQVMACSSQGVESAKRKPADQTGDAKAQNSDSPVDTELITGGIQVPGRTDEELQKPEKIFKKSPDAAAEPVPAGTPVVVPKNELGKPQVSADFNKLCAAAQSAKIFAASAGLKSVLGELCDGNVAKPLLTTTLLNNVYAGTGTLYFNTLRDLSSDRQTDTTSLRFGYAMKLPVTANDYFNRALPKSITPEGVKAVVEGPGGTATIRVLETYPKDGLYERGVRVNQVLEKKVNGRFDVTVESENRYDHHIAEEGFSYFATNIVIKPVSSIRTSDMLGMIVRLGDASYLIAVVDTSVNNRGHESIAENELARSVLVGSAALYERIISSSKP